MNDKPDRESASHAEFAGDVRSMFDRIARRYDIANHLLSGGVDFHWRRVAVNMSNVNDGDQLLDMCCGTGDLAFCFARHGTGLNQITGCDFSSEMIDIAKTKQKKLSSRSVTLKAQFDWVVGDCTKTHFEDESFDIVSCAFGVRNMADLDAGLSEMHRLLRKGGRACILEFSLPKLRLFRWAYLTYLRYILPLLGGVLTGRLSAYRYFADSILKWDTRIDLGKRLGIAGLTEIATRRLNFGIATVYVYKKP